MFALMAAMMCACNEKKNNESAEVDDDEDTIEALTRENEQLRNETNELLATINEIEDGFREINEAQNHVVIARRGEGENARERLQEDMQFIQKTMAENAELIKKLQARLRESGTKSTQLQHTIENMIAQMEQKTAEINQLRQELEAKNIHIAELDEQVASLTEDLSTLQEQSQQQGQTISQQDRQLNTAWYCIGTKSELKDASILKSGKVLQEGFDASYFTEIDVRNLSQIVIPYKDPKILTTHPAASYTLEKEESHKYTLHINDYQQFWSTSKYLVIQVK
jgi:chromosome segregation ATPase